ncbi:MAG: DUF3987 domain-containing protein [Flavobacteriaceae bacterium]|jgi:hypothetical protein|nr:DUF3987 domain-containing protein [Flavobacteriaceae bacterium]
MVSIYKEFKKVGSDSELGEIIECIKNGDYKEDINSIRYAVHSEDLKTADEIKSKLVGFTTSGTFGTARTKENITSYSKMICLDFDKLDHQELQEILTIIKICNYTYVSFISPSGNGIKVIVKVNCDADGHEEAYIQVAEHYKSITGIDYDKKCKDITRLCFISYDEDIYVNKNSEIFNPISEIKTVEPSKPIVNQSSNTDILLDKCLKFTEQKEQYHEGNRNNFIHLFASNANRFGIYQEDTLNFCLNNFDLQTKEIESTVKSAYKHQSADFAKFADYANRTENKKIQPTINKDKKEIDDEDYLLTSPTMTNVVYDNLPPIFKQGIEAFKEDREKDVFLTGALAVLSGCIPNVTGVYGGRRVYPNLFSFILAPAASGKGALQSAKELADKYHSEVLQNSLDQQKDYKRKLEEYKRAMRQAKKDEFVDMNEPEEPPFKVVFIPANASNASIIKHLQNNEGRGIICETEADTMGQAFKNDWGSYSDLLRKTFHNEKISITRKTNYEYFEINTPHLSVALSGTPKQIQNIIQSAEDGLFSRNIFYVFKTEAKWLDPSPEGNLVNLTEHFAMLSQNVYNMVNYLDNCETEIHLSPQQWAKLNTAFAEYLIQINAFVSSDAQSVVKRLGLILFRICMVFTAIRKFQAKETAKDVQCLDEDFDTAMAIIRVYLKHNVLMFENLTKQGEENDSPFKSGDNKYRFFAALPQKFSRQDAVILGDTFGIKERTVGTILKNCLGKYLMQPQYGMYEKIV